MELEIGSIYEGKVTGITKFGAFVQLPVGKSGMVHISEVANTYVDDINNYLKIGQTVTVKLIAIDEQGRINLSIKKALPPPAAEDRPARPPRPSRPAPAPAAAPAPKAGKLSAGDFRRMQDQSTLPRGDDSFESKLKAFMQSSESRMSDLRFQSDKRSGSRRRK
ncbi:MAG: S1 RNA-binding domain-containing protein [Clostridia bacterium]|nr:S1 RNA-binding domain-containing protein [Clostridia bacterium]MDD7672802.1 S1 RNA-binding domain-containing protein [Clostridia bacterium]MDY2929028.1 S1 RNA-binding domain-containing protein [Clostridiaceae bacterium]